MVNKISLSCMLKRCLILFLVIIPACSLFKEQYQRLPENSVLQKGGENTKQEGVAGWVIWVDGKRVFVRLNDGVKKNEGIYLHVYSSMEGETGIYKGLLRVKKIIREGVIEAERVKGIDVIGLFRPSIIPGDIVTDKKK